MLSRQELQRYSNQLLQIQEASLSDLDRILRRAQTMPANEAITFLQRMISSIVDGRGLVCAEAAARFYEQSRRAAIGGSYRSSLATSLPREQIAQNLHWATLPLADGEFARARSRLQRTVGRMVVTRAHNTIGQNVRRDHSLYARVPMGDNPCSFCVMQASRGFVFYTPDFDKWHDNCMCRSVPQWGDNPQIEGYDPEAYYDEYKKAYDATPSRKAGEKQEDYTKRLMATMRQQTGRR